MEKKNDYVDQFKLFKIQLSNPRLIYNSNQST